MTRDDRIDEIIGTWCEARDRGERIDPGELYRDHPDLADELRARFVTLDIIEQACAEPVLEPEAPREFRDYRILREIGRGGMGVVYEAEQMRMMRKVALKVLSVSITGTAQAVKRFQREAQAAGRLHHTNIVPVHDLNSHAGQWYYAMELVEGRALGAIIADLRAAGRRGSEERLARAALSTTMRGPTLPDPVSGTGTAARAYYHRVAELVAGVADGLEIAHEDGVIHRDIKPSNLLLDADGILKIVDFGLARFDDEALSMTVTGDLLGTPIYMSPEQAMAKRIVIDHRTDLYSLGATLYELLTLRPPFEAKSLPELCSQIITKDPIPPRKIDGRIPKDLETIVLKAMEKDRDKRYQSAREFARDLRAFASGENIRARRIGVVGRTWRKVKRHKVRSALAAAVVVAVALGGWLAVRLGDEAERRRVLEYERALSDAHAALLGTQGAMSDGIAFRTSFTTEGAVTTIRQTTPALVDGLELVNRAIRIDARRPEGYLLRAFLPGRTLTERLGDTQSALDRGLDPVVAHLARAVHYARHGQPDAATAEERLAEGEGEISGLAAYCRGLLYAWRGAHGEANASFRNAINGLPRDSYLRPLAYWERGLARMRAGELAAAAGDLVAARSSGCESSSLRLQIASLWSRLGQESEAEQVVLDCMREARSTERAEAWVRLAEALIPDGIVYAAASDRVWEWGRRITSAALEAHPGEPRLLMLAAQYATDPERTLELAEKALAKSPGFAAAERIRREALARSGRAEEALAEVDRSIESGSDDPALQTERATYLSKLDRLEEALQAAERASVLDPAYVGSVIVRLQVLSDLGRWDAVLSTIDRALRMAPRYRVQLQSHRARALSSLGRHEEALLAGKAAREADTASDAALDAYLFALLGLGRADEAWALCGIALGEHPDSTILLFRKMTLLSKIEGPAAAFQASEPLLDRKSVDQPVVRALRGRYLTKLGRNEEAVAEFEAGAPYPKRLGGAPEIFWAQALVDLGRIDEALELYDTAIRHDGFAMANAIRNRGALLARLNRNPEALDDLDRAIALQSDDAVAHANRSKVLLGMAKFDAALKAAERALSLGAECPADGHETCARILALEVQGIVFLQQGRFGEAVEVFRSLLKSHPEVPFAWARLGYCLHRTGKNEEALVAIEEGMKHDTSCPGGKHVLCPLAYALHTKGIVLVAMGREEEGLDAYRAVLEIHPEYAGTSGNLANTLIQLGRFREALDIAVRVRGAYPTYFPIHQVQCEALQALGRWEEATAAIGPAVEAGELRSKAILGMLLATCPEKELRDVRRALRLAQEYAQAQPEEWFSWVFLGRALLESGKPAEALRALSKAIELAKDNQESAIYNAFLLAMAKHDLSHEDAMSHYERAVGLMQASEFAPGRLHQLQRTRKQAEEKLELKRD